MYANKMFSDPVNTDLRRPLVRIEPGQGLSFTADGDHRYAVIRRPTLNFCPQFSMIASFRKQESNDMIIKGHIDGTPPPLWLEQYFPVRDPWKVAHQGRGQCHNKNNSCFIYILKKTD